MCTLWVAASADAADAWKAPRTADGQPDLQGIWTNATITPLEQPKEFGDRLVISAAEAKTIESQNQQFNDEADAPTRSQHAARRIYPTAAAWALPAPTAATTISGSIAARTRGRGEWRAAQLADRRARATDAFRSRRNGKRRSPSAS